MIDDSINNILHHHNDNNVSYYGGLFSTLKYVFYGLNQDGLMTL